MPDLQPLIDEGQPERGASVLAPAPGSHGWSLMTPAVYKQPTSSQKPQLAISEPNQKPQDTSVFLGFILFCLILEDNLYSKTC